ncbi:MAG: helix-turn-helix transcriptional regulator, partial [Christensenella sp.]
QPLTLNSIAETLNVSPYYLSHLFKKELGFNVIEYLNKVRIHNAKALLIETESTIQDISAAVGITDSNYFCRVFRKITGCTPSAFRSRNKH